MPRPAVDHDAVPLPVEVVLLEAGELGNAEGEVSSINGPCGDDLPLPQSNEKKPLMGVPDPPAGGTMTHLDGSRLVIEAGAVVRKGGFFAADRICGRTCGSGTGTARSAAGGSRATRAGAGGRCARNGTWGTVLRRRAVRLKPSFSRILKRRF